MGLSVIQTVSWLISKSVSQSVDLPVFQTVSWLISQSVSQSMIGWMGLSVIQMVSWSISQSVMKSVSQWASHLISLAYVQSNISFQWVLNLLMVTASQMLNQSVSWSLCQSSDKPFIGKRNSHTAHLTISRWVSKSMKWLASWSIKKKTNQDKNLSGWKKNSQFMDKHRIKVKSIKW